MSTKQTTHHTSKSPTSTNHYRPPFWTLPNGGYGFDNRPPQIARVQRCSHSLLRLFLPFSSSSLSWTVVSESRSYSLFCQPRHLPFHHHASSLLHLPTWLFFTLISNSDSLCLPSYLRRLVQYRDLLWQALPRPFLYLTVASMMTKP